MLSIEINYLKFCVTILNASANAIGIENGHRKFQIIHVYVLSYYGHYNNVLSGATALMVGF
jgi:hypothetical protein